MTDAPIVPMLTRIGCRKCKSAWVTKKDELLTDKFTESITSNQFGGVDYTVATCVFCTPGVKDTRSVLRVGEKAVYAAAFVAELNRMQGTTPCLHGSERMGSLVFNSAVHAAKAVLAFRKGEEIMRRTFAEANTEKGTETLRMYLDMIGAKE